MSSNQKIYHQRLSDRLSIAAAVKDINNNVNGTGLDFREDTKGRYQSIAWINFNEPGMLIILASFDFSYTTTLKLPFIMQASDIPSEGSWWGHWSKDQLELSGEDYAEGFEFRFNIGTHTDRQFLVRAKTFSYHIERISRNR